MEPIKITMEVQSHSSGGAKGGNVTRQVVLRHEGKANDTLFDLPAHGMINVVLSEVTAAVALGFLPGKKYLVTIAEAAE